jgi:Flp pilus assembly protein TadG
MQTMKRVTMKKIKNERGQSLVELAISLVLLLVLLSGAVEFGMAFFQFIQLRDAAQEGALYGSINPTAASAIETRARGASTSPINLADTSKVTVTITAKDKTTNNTKALSSACEGDGLVVKLTYQHQVFMPFMSAIVGSTLPLNATVTDTVLSPVCP